MKYKMITMCSLSIILLVQDTLQAKIAPTSIEELIRISQYSLIGKVLKVMEIDGVQIAEVKIIKMLKGKLDRDKIYMIGAARRSVCNSSCAVLGETVLLFLERYPDQREYDPDQLDPDAKLETKLREAVDGTQLFFISWDGSGRMPVKRINHKDYLFTYDIKDEGERFFKGIKTIASPEKTELPERLALLKDVINYVQSEVKKYKTNR